MKNSVCSIQDNGNFSAYKIDSNHLWFVHKNIKPVWDGHTWKMWEVCCGFYRLTSVSNIGTSTNSHCINWRGNPNSKRLLCLFGNLDFVWFLRGHSGQNRQLVQHTFRAFHVSSMLGESRDMIECMIRFRSGQTPTFTACRACSDLGLSLQFQ